MNLQRRQPLALLVLAAGTPLGFPSSAQGPGEVLLAQKASQAEGGFLGSLHDGDEFGYAVAVSLFPPSFDEGYGQVATAPGDDEEGPDRGALWLLQTRDQHSGLLHPSGQVKLGSASAPFAGLLDDGDRLGSSVACSFLLFTEEILVGAVGDDDGGTDRGAVYSTERAYGSSSLSLLSKISATSGGFTGDLDDFDAFGSSVAWMYDLDGDSFSDIVVGAPGDDDGGTDRGAVWVLFLNEDRTVKAHAKISATSGGFLGALDDGDAFGSSVAHLWDLDADGRVELAVGAPGDDDGGSDRGALWILRLEPSGSVHSYLKLGASTPGFGAALSDGDAFGSAACLMPSEPPHPRSDLAVGAPGTDAGGVDAGAVYRLSLLADLSIESYVAVHAGAGGLGDVLGAGDRFGSCVSSTEVADAYDVLFADVQVGAPGDDDGGAERGAHWNLGMDRGVPPVLAFSAMPTAGTAPLLVQFHDETDSGPPGITPNHVVGWDFGDGTSSSSQYDYDPAHTYDLPGSYTVTLHVWAPGGVESLSKTDYVSVDAPAAPDASFTAQVTTGYAPLEVAFTDTSTSHVDTWAWDFGDGGTSSDQNPTHTYAAGGDYTVSLTVSGLGGMDSETRLGFIHVVDPFVVDFGADPTSGFAPLDVAFTNLSAGTPEAWLWDFGDGGTSSEASPVHTYTTAGTYSVTLSALQGEDSIDQTRTDLVAVDGPSADFGGSPLTGQAPVTVQFTDLSEGLVTAWTWDFGDGGSSTEQHPSHTYPFPGDYTVSLEVSGAGTSSVETKLDYVSVDPGLPVADFAAVPTSGEVPLAVQFTDLSFDATGWSWDFGDGTGSTDQHPAHTYVLPGAYTVTLVASNSLGTHALTREDYVACSPPPGLYDPSFELQTAGTPPTGSWEVSFGDGHVIDPAGGPASDNAFPTDGSLWCEVAADSTAGAIPPSNPGGATDPPSGGAGVRTTFQWLAGRPLLEFDAAFLVHGPPNQAAANDWMSVDVSDGTSTYNLYYADTFSPSPDVSAKYGFAMTATTRVSANLASLFPLSTPATDLALMVQVGNGGDGLLPSKGYVDDFRLEPAATVTLYGSGVNPPGSLSIVFGEPGLGDSVVLGIDNPLGTQPPMLSVPILFLSLAPDPGFPAGTLWPGLGMDGGPGEILIRLGTFALTPLVGPPWSGPGIPAPVAIDVPNDATLIGATIYGQGILAAPTVGPSFVRFGLTDAARLILGP